MTKILLVEDHPDIRDVVQIQLARLGFAVIMLRTARKALRQLLPTNLA